MDKIVQKILSVIMVGFLLVAYILLLSGASSGTLKTRCLNCTQQEKIFYRVLYPGSPVSSACVWSSAHLGPDPFIFGRACSEKECEVIEKPVRNFLNGEIDCRF